LFFETGSGCVALSSTTSYLSLLSAGIIGIHHHTQPNNHFYILYILIWGPIGEQDIVGFKNETNISMGQKWNRNYSDDQGLAMAWGLEANRMAHTQCRVTRPKYPSTGSRKRFMVWDQGQSACCWHGPSLPLPSSSSVTTLHTSPSFNL
jgi:hypothetical protein